MCFRRFNSTHQFGCQSKHDGSVGTIQLIRDETDIDLVIKDGSNFPYIPCLTTKYFTYENIIKFRDSKRVSGLVLFDVQSKDKLPNSFTEDKRCPNEMTSYYKDNEVYGHCKREEWNKFAPSIESISELDLDFPMILIRDKENITSIEQCFNDFNVKGTSKTSDLICSMELKTWMFGAKNSKVCMSRSTSGVNFESVLYCDSVSSYNLFNTLFKYENETLDDQLKNRSVLVLASRIDSLSIFDNSASGASTTLTSLITIFSVMDIMKQLNLEKNKNKNIMYALFDGEAFDYIGSGRAAFDLGTTGLEPKLMVDKKFKGLKISKNHLHSVIEINQATFMNDKFFIHTDPLTRDKIEVKEELNKLIDSLTKSEIIKKVNESLNQPLPPSSVQQLLAHDQNLPVLVISNHESEYVNKFYNSFLDDDRAIGLNKEQIIEKIAKLSESIASTLITFLNQNPNKANINANNYLINKLYNCLIEDSKCEFFDEIRGAKSNLPNDYKTYPLYIRSDSQSYHFEYVYTLNRLSSWLTGQIEPNITTKDACKKLNKKIESNSSFEYFKIDNKAICLETTSFVTEAKSPVFIYEPPNWSLNYSTWTESVWNTPKVRLFVTSSKLQEYFTFITGLLVMISSFFISKYISKNADILFIDLSTDV